MASRIRELKTDGSGQFYRQLGRKAGVKGQAKFRLGSDRLKAELAYQKLGMLWRVVVAQHEAIERATSDFDGAPASEPVWTPESLTIAEAIRKHLHTIHVGPPEHAEGAAAYATYLDHLRQTYGHLINIVPADTAAAEKGKAEHRHFAEHRARQARINARIASVPIPAGLTGTTLYQALDRYAARAVELNPKESGKVEAANALRLKASTADVDLSEFGFAAMERIRAYWTARPVAKMRGGKSTGRRISLTTVDNHLSTARRFVRWLDRTDEFSWELPRHGLDALTVNLKRLETHEERAARRHGVKVFAIDHIITIYRVATDFERVLVLLGLNAAMAQAEVGTLRWDEIEDEPVPTIKRVRQKSGVYGEFPLWDHTQTALGWWRKMRPPTGPLVMTTSSGRALMRTEIANAWAKLRGRVERTSGTPADWWLPFKFLRKTAAQLVRQASDGEVAGTFLSHGQPVATDDLADRYSNRPFDRVARALQKVRSQLQPMFDAAPEAFTSSTFGCVQGRRKLTT